jgi:serine/threonine protein kinase
MIVCALAMHLFSAMQPSRHSAHKQNVTPLGINVFWSSTKAHQFTMTDEDKEAKKCRGSPAATKHHDMTMPHLSPAIYNIQVRQLTAKCIDYGTYGQIFPVWYKNDCNFVAKLSKQIPYPAHHHQTKSNKGGGDAGQEAEEGKLVLGAKGILTTAYRECQAYAALRGTSTTSSGTYLGETTIPRIVAFSALDTGTVSLVMPRYQGSLYTALHKLEKARQILSLVAIQRCMTQLMAALEWAHSRNIVHRDIKPGNILVSHMDLERPDIRIYLADWGSSKSHVSMDINVHDNDATKLVNNDDDPMVPFATTFPITTCFFESPEHALHVSANPRGYDTWGAGIILMCLLSGTPQIMEPLNDLPSDSELSGTSAPPTGGAYPMGKYNRYYREHVGPLFHYFGHPTTEEWPVFQSRMKQYCQFPLQCGVATDGPFNRVKESTGQQRIKYCYRCRPIPTQATRIKKQIFARYATTLAHGRGGCLLPALDCFFQLCSLNPQKRPSIEQVFRNHPFFTEATTTCPQEEDLQEASPRLLKKAVTQIHHPMTATLSDATVGNAVDWIIIIGYLDLRWKLETIETAVRIWCLLVTGSKSHLLAAGHKMDAVFLALWQAMQLFEPQQYACETMHPLLESYLDQTFLPRYPTPLWTSDDDGEATYLQRLLELERATFANVILAQPGPYIISALTQVQSLHDTNNLVSQQSLPPHIVGWTLTILRANALHRIDAATLTASLLHLHNLMQPIHVQDACPVGSTTDPATLSAASLIISAQSHWPPTLYKALQM